MRLRQLLLSVTAAAAILTLAAAMAQSAEALPYEQSIEFYGSRLCLNDPQGNTSNGVQLNVWECNVGPNQLFDFVPSHTEPGDYLIRLSADPAKCLADPWGSYEDGIKLELYTCSDTAAFQWEWSQLFNASTFVNPHRMAFGNKDGVRENGNPVIMWEVNWGWEQTWSVLP